MTDYLFMKKKDGIATLYMNRPEKRNAFNMDMWCAIPEMLKEAEQDDDIGVFIIRGVDGTAFAAGADIGEFKTLLASTEKARQYTEALASANAALTDFPKPTIAMIQKYCMGGGCLLASACDMRFSSESGVFGIPQAKLGLIYPFSAMKNVVNLVGPARAKDILFSGRELDASEAYRYGLVDRIYPEEQIEAKTYEYAQLLLTRSQTSIKGAKKIIAEMMNGMTEEPDDINRMIVASLASADFREGVTAFLEKRSPRFREAQSKRE